jgi:hypothetical protein
MANTIILKRSSTPSKVPTTSQLALGEIAINTYDGRIFIKKDDGNPAVVEIGGVTTVNTYGGDVVLGTLTKVLVTFILQQPVLAPL